MSLFLIREPDRLAIRKWAEKVACGCIRYFIEKKRAFHAIRGAVARPPVQALAD